MQNRSKQQEVLYEILLQMLYERSEVISDKCSPWVWSTLEQNQTI